MRALIASVAGLLVLVGCSVNDPHGYMSVGVVGNAPAKILAGATLPYENVIVKLVRVEAMQNGQGVVVLKDFGEDGLLIDLMDYVGGDTLDLLNDVQIPVGKYSKLRLVVTAPLQGEGAPTTPESYVKLLGDENLYPLFIPSGCNTGMKINLQQFDVNEEEAVTLVVGFDPDWAIVDLGGDPDPAARSFIIKPSALRVYKGLVNIVDDPVVDPDQEPR